MAGVFLRAAQDANECGSRADFTANVKMMLIALGKPEIR